MKTSRLNAADLIACVNFGPEGLARAAGLMGFQSHATPAAKLKPDRETPEMAPTPRVKTEPVLEPEQPQMPTMQRRIWHAVHGRPIPQEEVVTQVPPWFEKAVPCKPGETLGNPTAKIPMKQPLTPWSRCWPVLKQILGAWVESDEPDLDRLVDKMARGEVITEFPGQRRRGWAGRAWIMVDFGKRMQPFWEDIRELIRALLLLRGTEGLNLVYCKGDPAAGWCRWGTQKPVTSFPKGPRTPVLVISDLGCPDFHGGWSRMAEKLRRCGIKPMVLTPVSALSWRESTWIPLFWDRGSSLKAGRPGPRPHRSAVLDLMSLAAPAVRVEPGLLRAIRYLLPVGVGSVDDERAVWLHDDTRASPMGFDYQPERVSHWRDRFIQQSEDLQEAVLGLIGEYHGHLPKTVIEEERLVADYLIGRTCESALMADLTKNLKRGDIAALQWFERVAARQHASIWANEQMAAAGIIAKCGLAKQQGREMKDHSLPEGLDINQAAWLFEPSAEPTFWTLVQAGRGGFQFLPDDDPDVKTRKPLADWSTRTGVLKLEIGGKTRLLELAGHRDFHVTGTEPFVLHGDQQEMTFAPVERPVWAGRIVSNRDGVSVIPKGEDRSLVWVPPGETSVIGDQGEIGSYQRVDGFWMDASQFARLKEGFKQPSWAEAFGVDDYGIYADWSVKEQTQRMRWIWPGSFLMGSPADEPGRSDDETQHEVVLSRGFWMADTACTTQLWSTLMRNQLHPFIVRDQPISNIHMEEISQFMSLLNLEKKVMDFGLPTEAEWEYACRAGTQTPFSFGESVTTEIANFNGMKPYKNGLREKTKNNLLEVKALPINPWGLYQMHGNICEWCRDWYGFYSEAPTVDPTGPENGENMVLRGGSYAWRVVDVRSAARAALKPHTRSLDAGFRIIMRAD